MTNPEQRTAPGGIPGNGLGPSNGALPALTPVGPMVGRFDGWASGTRSSYLDYLPAIYAENDFMGRFLMIFESILGPLDRTSLDLHHLLDPTVCPPDLLAWLGGWLGLVLDDRWPVERRRAIVGGASDLYRWRGTPRGLREFVRLYTGYVPDILEPTSAQVAADRSLAFSFVLRLQVPAGAIVSQELLETIVEVEKPAFARYIVNIEVMGA